jgi:hypothetical protein
MYFTSSTSAVRRPVGVLNVTALNLSSSSHKLLGDTTFKKHMQNICDCFARAGGRILLFCSYECRQVIVHPESK